MNILRNAGFDSIVHNNIEYKKNTNKNYKNYIKYISKFDDLFIDKEGFIEDFRNEFYSMYGITLTDNDIAKLSLLYALIGKANNGLINVITDYQLTAMNGITKKTTSDEASYKIYLHSIGIDYTSNDYINHQKLHQIKHSLLYHHYITLPMNKDKTIDRIERHCQIMRFSDLLFFYYTMEKSIITKEIEFSINSNIIDKIVNDLTSIYENLKEIEIKKISKEEMISNYFIPNYNKLQEMILRNKNLYERVS